MTEEIERICVVCGKTLHITINEDNTYSGAHYFGKMNLGNEHAEYWECDDCYEEWPE